MKSLIPALREKKRYLVFEVISDRDASNVTEAIRETMIRLFGEIDVSKAGLMFLESKNNRGVIRVAHNYVDKLKAALVMTNLENTILRSVYVSGILNKALSEVK